MLPTCVWWFDSTLATIMVETVTRAKEKNMKTDTIVSKWRKWCKGKPERKNRRMPHSRSRAIPIRTQKTTEEGKVQCNKCGKETNIYLFHKKGTFCVECFYAETAPKMTLVEFYITEGRLLWNSTQKVYETKMRIADFEKCGWFVRQIREGGVYIYYDLEYCGKFECKRCGDYSFPIKTEKCPEESRCLSQTSNKTTRVYH